MTRISPTTPGPRGQPRTTLSCPSYLRALLLLPMQKCIIDARMHPSSYLSPQLLTLPPRSI